MLFQSTVPAIINDMNLTYYNSATQTRKTTTADRLNMYHSAQAERLEEQLTALFSDPDSMTQTFMNIVKKIINSLAQVYITAPIRSLADGTVSDKQIYSDLQDQCNLDVKIKQASRYAKLLKSILLRPVWRDNQMDLDILTGNILDVVTGDSPEILKKVLITNYGTTERIEDTTYSLWTKESWSQLDYNGNILEEQENPYEILPFLPVFDFAPPSSGFWLPGNDDLISIQESINLKLTDLMYLIQQQSFGVGYLKGGSQGTSMKVDPGSLVELTTDGEIGFVSQKAEISQVLAAIDKLAKWAAVTHGLSAGSMSTTITEQSGASKSWDSKELHELRGDDIIIWRTYEKKLFNLMRVINNYHSDKKLSDKCSLQIDFADPQPKLSTKDQAIADGLRIEQGVISQVDILMRDNPDRFQGDRESALAYLLKIKEETDALTV